VPPGKYNPLEGPLAAGPCDRLAGDVPADRRSMVTRHPLSCILEAPMKLSWLLSGSILVALVVVAAGVPGGSADTRLVPEIRQFTLHALDHHLDIYDLRRDRRGFSRQIDAEVREYVGDILFSGGDRFVVLENDRYSGKFLDLGKESMPDTEFSLFYSLDIYKSTFRRLEFPYGDRFLPYPGIDSRAFFRENRDPRTTVRVSLGHTYLLRLFHRTRVGDQRVFALRVVDFTPGVKVTVVWRELPLLREDREAEHL
jgi:hypothetical protein